MTSRGFTLIELILAVLIFSMIGTLTYGALSATFKTQTTIAERTTLQEIGTAAIAKMRDDLSQAFIVEAVKQTTHLRGEDNFEKSKLTFTAMSRDRSGPEMHESDQAEITFDLESDPTNPQLNQLRRRENRVLDTQIKETGDAIVLATHVISFRAEYSDGQTYSAKWDSRSDEHRNKLPKTVRVSLRLKDEKNREENYEEIIEIPMADGIGIERPQAGSGPNGVGGQTVVPGASGTPGQPPLGGQQPGTLPGAPRGGPRPGPRPSFGQGPQGGVTR